MSTLDTIKAWVREKMGAAPVPQPPANVHTPAPESPEGLSISFLQKERPDVYGALSARDETPTAEWLERKRMERARDAFEKKWDIGLD